MRVVAVIDVGKTNAKVALVLAADGTELALRKTATVVRNGDPYPHVDVPLLWDFICNALTDLQAQDGIDAISITAHGSAGALLSQDGAEDGLALPILDYEFAGPDEFAADYDAIRPAFEETLSPRLPAGLNLGAQIFWQERRFREAFSSAGPYVNYPQYWAWRLCGVAATEMCSMGAHSDLWDPRRLSWSSLVDRCGWRRFLAPLRSAFDRLGPIRPELAARLGLDPATLVHCGIHDSSASLLPHLTQRQPPFTVVSTGTWMILFAVGGGLDGLDPTRDTLANVTAFGDPVPCARFMGGREFELLAGSSPAEPSDADLDRVLSERIMALPSLVSGVGPFARRTGGWMGLAESLSPGERAAAASLYIALVTAESMRLAGAAGRVIVEGPFARNRIFCRALAATTAVSVEPAAGATGTTRGAALLAAGGAALGIPSGSTTVEPLGNSAFPAYRDHWLASART